VRTDELIAQLAVRAPGKRPGVPVQLAVTGLIGALGALALVFIRFGVRPDLAAATSTGSFWMKLAYGLAIAGAGLVALERLSRPVGSGRRGLVLAALAFLVLGAFGVAQIASTGADQRMAIWLGRSWRVCPTNVLMLALPMLALGLLVLRGLAPTRPMLAGAATGLFAGGVAMVAYGLHCPETEPAFVATWYTLGALLPTALGAVLGPLVLRWR
jgi:hypothetical protein